MPVFPKRSASNTESVHMRACTCYENCFMDQETHERNGDTGCFSPIYESINWIANVTYNV